MLLLKALAVHALISRSLTATHCPSHVDLRRHQNHVNKWRRITSDPNALHAILDFQFLSFPLDGRAKEQLSFGGKEVVVVVVATAIKMSDSSKMSSEAPPPLLLRPQLNQLR